MSGSSMGSCSFAGSVSRKARAASGVSIPRAHKAAAASGVKPQLRASDRTVSSLDSAVTHRFIFMVIPRSIFIQTYHSRKSMKSQHFLPLFLVLYSANAKKAAFPAFPVFHPLSPASFPRDALLPTPCIASLPQRVPVSGRPAAWRQRLRAPDMSRTPGISRRNIPFFQKRKKLHLRIADAAFFITVCS